MDMTALGLGLFALIYLYAWFKDYDDIAQSAMSISAKMPEFWNMVTAMSAFCWNVLGTGIVVFLMLLVLSLTCLRALSFMARQRAFDPFPMDVAFRWIFTTRVIKALVAGSLLSTLMVALAIVAYRRMVTPVDTTDKRLRARVKRAVARAFFPQLPADVQSKDAQSRVARAFQALFSSVLVTNLVVLFLTVLLAYTRYMPGVNLPESAMPSIGASSYSFEDYRRDYAKLFRKKGRTMFYTLSSSESSSESS